MVCISIASSLVSSLCCPCIISVILISSLSSSSHHHPIFSIGLLPSSSSLLHRLPHFIMMTMNHCLPLVVVSSFCLPHLLVIFLISLSLVHYHHLHHLINVFLILSLSSRHSCLLTSSSCHLCRPHLVLFTLLISKSSRYRSSSHHRHLCQHPVVVIIAFIWSSFHHDSCIIIFPLSSFHCFIFHISSSSFSS